MAAGSRPGSVADELAGWDQDGSRRAGWTPEYHFAAAPLLRTVASGAPPPPPVAGHTDLTGTRPRSSLEASVLAVPAAAVVGAYLVEGMRPAGSRTVEAR